MADDRSELFEPALNFRNSHPSGFQINFADGRTALTMRLDGDRIVADYDPDDLDDAAKIFVEQVIAPLRAEG